MGNTIGTRAHQYYANTSCAINYFGSIHHVNCEMVWPFFFNGECVKMRALSWHMLSLILV